MSLARLEAEVAALRGAGRPDEWARAAYRLGVARSETAADEAGLRAAVDLLERAGQTLSEDREPVIHARILTAVGSCRRRLGEPEAAAALFDRAAGLLAGRVSATQEAAALVNCGLAATEAGRPAAALAPLDRALALLDAADHDEAEIPDDPDDGDAGERRRVRGAALLNRAQARQAVASPEHLAGAVEDYRAAATAFEEDGPQRAMALHGLGSALLDLAAASPSSAARSLLTESGEPPNADGKRGGDDTPETAEKGAAEGRETAQPGAQSVGQGGGQSDGALPAADVPGEMIDSAGGGEREPAEKGAVELADEAVAAFGASLRILTLEAFPFRHAVARHSLALAYERRGGPLDLLRAAESAEAALAVFDPRLQRQHWQVAAATLARIESAAVSQAPPLSAGEQTAVTDGQSVPGGQRAVEGEGSVAAGGPPGVGEGEVGPGEQRAVGGGLCATDTRAGVGGGRADGGEGLGLGGGAERMARFAQLLDGVEEDERVELLRRRLARTAAQPEMVRRRDCGALAAAVTGTGPAGYERLLRTMVPVLMELPEPLLAAMCGALCEAHGATGEPTVYDEALDRVIHDRLFGPQRVRMRDLLEAHGWLRP